MPNYTKGEWKAFRFSQYHNWKVAMGDVNEFLDLGLEGEANAHLIAAAPALYEALKGMLNIFNRGQSVGAVGYVICAEAEQALSKAEGK